MTQRTATDTTALLLAAIVAFFVVASMAVIIIFAFNGVPSGENIWAGMFSLVTAILGGITGYLGGQAAQARKQQRPSIAPAPPEEPPL